jgi:hypothetical protein
MPFPFPCRHRSEPDIGFARVTDNDIGRLADAFIDVLAGVSFV